MLAQLAISLGGGHATVHLDVSWRRGPQPGRWVGPIALFLTAPIVLLLGVQAIGLATGDSGFRDFVNASGGTWTHLLIGATISVAVALVLVVVSRLRIGLERQDATRGLTVTLGLTVLEAVAVLVAAGFFVLLAAHLVADGLACARGVLHAC